MPQLLEPLRSGRYRDYILINTVWGLYGVFVNSFAVLYAVRILHIDFFVIMLWSTLGNFMRALCAGPAARIAGEGFSSVGLGIVHSMAHSLGAVYDTPHGVANAILLPTIMEYNAPYTGEKYREIARAMGVEGVDGMTQDEYRKAACDAVKQLSMDVGIPADLKEIVKDEDVQFLSESAYADACRPGNPRDTSVEEIAALYRSLL